jgi:hypothetical protein
MGRPRLRARIATLLKPEFSMSRQGELRIALDQFRDGRFVGQLLEAFDLFLINGAALGRSGKAGIGKRLWAEDRPVA